MRTDTPPAAVTFVLGKPIDRSPVLPDVAGHLRQHGLDVATSAPRDASGLAELAPRLDRSELVIVRGLSWDVLDGLTGWSDRCVNTPAATSAVVDRWYVHQALVAAGLPVPATRHLRSWSDVLQAGADTVVKAADGRRGRSAGVLLPGVTRPAKPDIHGPWVVQEAAPQGSWEAKCYVVGEDVRVLRRPVQAGAQDRTALQVAHRATVEVSEPPAALVEVARAAARVAHLDIAGVDVLVAPQGSMMIIDINAFPSAARVPGAAAWIGSYLRQRVDR